MFLLHTMVPPASLQCPWCEHETDEADGFRTHLMVQHRKSDLATYVLHGVDGDREPDQPLRH